MVHEHIAQFPRAVRLCQTILDEVVDDCVNLALYPRALELPNDAALQQYDRAEQCRASDDQIARPPYTGCLIADAVEGCCLDYAIRNSA